MSPESTQLETQRETLLRRVASFGIRPFREHVVQSPWHDVIDAEPLHRDVKERIRSVIASCSQPKATRFLTVIGPAGYGKTHLLARTRQMLEHAEKPDALFIYVPPYLPGGSGTESFEQHVLSSTLDGLWLRSLRQHDACRTVVRTFLVGCYDRIIDSGREIRATLRAGTFLSRLCFRDSLRISKCGPEDQLAALQKAFSRRAFFQHAFAEFMRNCPSNADGAQPDWDAFVATCLLTCGDTNQSWHADRWFRGDRIPLEVFAPFHLVKHCQGPQKICNVLFTLNRLLNQAFCLAFDQVEDTYEALQRAGGGSEQFGHMLAILLRNLGVIPGFCLLFMFQQSNWQDFAQKAPKMLIDRMIEGDGAQTLGPLDHETATELLRVRMEAAIWRLSPGEHPPENEPCFPFQAEDVRRLLTATGGELREFLQRAQADFDQRLRPQPAPPRPIILSSIDPPEVVAGLATTILVRGEHIPPSVVVTLGGHSVPARPGQNDGEIDITIPGGLGLEGDVQMRVQDANNTGTISIGIPFYLAQPELIDYHQSEPALLS